ncbi:DUF2934 domain-containing protein [Methylobacter svalbardensis]|uniref:DUF2934 domain-containing protein n=1 Tax=Methylobacter svalbardensis TaxID=3080016 RepID=UPI0030EB7D57
MLSHAVKPVNRHQWISEAAYYKALARKFESGKELADWLEAELDYSNMLIALYISILEEDGAMTIFSLQQLGKVYRHSKFGGYSFRNRTGRGNSIMLPNIQILDSSEARDMSVEERA